MHAVAVATPRDTTPRQAYASTRDDKNVFALSQRLLALAQSGSDDASVRDTLSVLRVTAFEIAQQFADEQQEA